MSGVGLNLRVSYKLSQGGRKYMEDMYCVHFVESDDGETQLAFIGVFDGHGGREAAEFAKKRLIREIISQDCFWVDDDDEQVLKAIRNGFIATHNAMWKEVGNWPKTASGFPSTAGCTASIGIIRHSKIYIGHVGDSAIVVGGQEEGSTTFKPTRLTKDHKPGSPEERKRIEKMGGAVVSGKSGVQRVVWNRPAVSHKGPVRRSTQLEAVPFLAVARSLGDLWSYNFGSDEFAVSPEPDVSVYQLDPAKHKCLVFGSDGLWNMLSPGESVRAVQIVEKEIEDRILNDPSVSINYWVNPSAKLVDTALLRWHSNMMRPDNTTAIVVLIDAYGPKKSERLLAQRKINMKKLKEREKMKLEETKDKNYPKVMYPSPHVLATLDKAKNMEAHLSDKAQNQDSPNKNDAEHRSNISHFRSKSTENLELIRIAGSGSETPDINTINADSDSGIDVVDSPHTETDGSSSDKDSIHVASKTSPKPSALKKQNAVNRSPPSSSLSSQDSAGQSSGSSTSNEQIPDSANSRKSSSKITSELNSKKLSLNSKVIHNQTLSNKKVVPSLSQKEIIQQQNKMEENGEQCENTLVQDRRPKRRAARRVEANGRSALSTRSSTTSDNQSSRMTLRHDANKLANTCSPGGSVRRGTRQSSQGKTPTYTGLKRKNVELSNPQQHQKKRARVV